jgi:hypothetical protein
MKPGPFCIEIAGECRTQRELGYRTSEYYEIDGVGLMMKAGIYTSIAEARFPNDSYVKAGAWCEAHKVSLLTLFYAIEAKERLGFAYLAAYKRAHPNRANFDDRYGLHHSFYWDIDQDGHVVEAESVWGDGD